MSKIAASILAADTMHMGDAVRLIQESGCDAIHFDVMDGVFVPNISFGPKLLEDMSAEFDAWFDVHLMLADPSHYIDVFAQSGANMITVHLESANYQQAIKRIRELGLQVGVSLKPATPASALQTLHDMPDMVLVMSVEPGFGGQAFMPEMIEKVAQLRTMGYTGEIEVDGGVNLENGKLLAEAGADILVMGTKFFKSENPAELVRQIHQLGKNKL